MRRIPILLLLATGLWIIGCGSNNTMSKTPSNPGQPSPTPTPTPTPTPGTTQFSETMLSNDSTGTVDGTVTVDTNGNGTMKLTGGGTANTAYTIAFCPFATGSCNNVGTLNADSSGTGSGTFTMGHGGFSGNFELTSGSDIPFLSALDIPANGSSLQAALVRASSVSGGFPNMTNVGFGIGSDTLSSGTVTYNAGSSVNLQVTGAAASQAYDVTFCFNGGGSSCFEMGQLTTDAGGGGSATFDLSTAVGAGNADSGVFFLSTGKPPVIQFVGGFSVP
jgi:hypothetical protein